MSIKTHQKIDLFYIILPIVSVALAIFAIFTFQGVFSAVISAYDTGSGQVNDIRVNKDKMNEAYDKVFNKEHVKLNIGG